ncbi:vang-like protein 2 [Ornithodoros turicata]|uniref:vang-like protein 2 n=1 Tax=Ornithodoros turicata TaxID=34597 RepID=UPI00313944CD
MSSALWSGEIQHGCGLPPAYKNPLSNHETESLKSGGHGSERSRRSNNHNNSSSRHQHSNHNNHQNQGGDHGSYRATRRHSHRSTRSCPTQVKVGQQDHRREEVIEVQILPQDDNWGDNTTAITGNTSDRSMSDEDVSRLGREPGLPATFRCQMWAGTVLTAILSLAAFLSPVVMVVLPKIELFEWKVQKCGPECDGLLISFAFKLLILLVASWALFFRKPRATMPRIFILRAIVLALVFVFIFSYWLFYCVRVFEKRHSDYELTYLSIVQFALSLVDALLFVHYLAVILVEIRQIQPQYYVKIVRSPDGHSRGYVLGQLSIQRASVWILERYYRDFPIYNPYLETLPTARARKQQQAYKVYDVDGVNCDGNNTRGTATVVPTGRRPSHNDRFYEEHEYERRVRKRKSRLVSAAEDAFTHIKRIQDENGPAIPMDPTEAAQAIFPSMARALQKYLRITRQQPRHTMQGILDHLAQCLHYDLSPRAFLEKYLQSSPVLQDDREVREVQTWALVCDVLLSRPIKPGVSFLLRQGDVSLLVTVHALPHLNVTEEIVDPKSNRFVLRLNSETSV